MNLPKQIPVANYSIQRALRRFQCILINHPRGNFFRRFMPPSCSVSSFWTQISRCRIDFPVSRCLQKHRHTSERAVGCKEKNGSLPSIRRQRPAGFNSTDGKEKTVVKRGNLEPKDAGITRRTGGSKWPKMCNLQSNSSLARDQKTSRIRGDTGIHRIKQH